MLGVLNAAREGNAPANSPVYELYSICLRDPLTSQLDVCTEGVGAGLGARPYADGVDLVAFEVVAASCATCASWLRGC